MKYRYPDVHEFALLLPVADGEERESMLEDIVKHGIVTPCVLFQGKVLDGRSRMVIAKRLGIPCPTTEFRGTALQALELVASYNLYRRHLNQSQKAASAVKISEELQRLSGLDAKEAKQEAMKITGAKSSTFDRVKKLAQESPEVVEKIIEGKTTVGEQIGRSDCICPRCGHRW